MASQKKAYLALTVTSIVWGTTWVASKIGISHMHAAFQLASIRQFLGGSIYVIFFLIKGEKETSSSKNSKLASVYAIIFKICCSRFLIQEDKVP